MTRKAVKKSAAPSLWDASARRRRLQPRSCFLCTEYASFITGEVFNVNGGAVLVG